MNSVYRAVEGVLSRLPKPWKVTGPAASPEFIETLIVASKYRVTKRYASRVGLSRVVAAYAPCGY